MFKNITNPDNPLMITMTQVTDCIFLSLFWILGCFPVVTAATAWAALYDASFRGMRLGDKHSWQRFWHVFRTNWKAGILPSIVLLAALAAGAKGLTALWNAAVYGQISWVLFAAGAIFGVVAVGVLVLMPAVLSRFENSFAGLLKNTVLLAFANMHRTMALGIICAICGVLCLRFVFPVFFLPALAALLSTWLIEPMFKPYMDAAA